MGFRFRKSIKIAPGVRINLSKSSASTSLGGKGFTANLSKRGIRGTAGVPGSGLSYSAMVGGRTKARSASNGQALSDEVLSSSNETEDVGGVALLMGIGGPVAFASFAADSVASWFGWLLSLMLFGFTMLAIGRTTTGAAPITD